MPAITLLSVRTFSNYRRCLAKALPRLCLCAMCLLLGGHPKPHDSSGYVWAVHREMGQAVCRDSGFERVEPCHVQYARVEQSAEEWALDRRLTALWACRPAVLTRASNLTGNQQLSNSTLETGGMGSSRNWGLDFGSGGITSQLRQDPKKPPTGNALNLGSATQKARRSLDWFGRWVPVVSRVY